MDPSIVGRSPLPLYVNLPTRDTTTSSYNIRKSTSTTNNITTTSNNLSYGLLATSPVISGMRASSPMRAHSPMRDLSPVRAVSAGGRGVSCPPSPGKEGSSAPPSPSPSRSSQPLSPLHQVFYKFMKILSK